MRLSVQAVFAGVLVAAAGTWSAGQAGGKIELGRRYFDQLYGYSFCPPADSQRIREVTTKPQMSWVYRDEKTGAIAWTLRVVQAATAAEKIDLVPYSKALADKLRSDENFQVDSVEVAPLAGKAAMHFRGVVGGELRLWQRQVWVLTGPGHFLIFRVFGPVDLKERLDAMCEAVVNTLQLTDPESARKERKENLARGQDLLDAVTETKISEALHREPQWFLLSLKDKEVGFVRVVESAVPYKGIDGYMVKTWTMVEIPKEPLRLLRREMFTTGDRKLERWLDRWQNGSGRKGELTENGAESGLTQENLIVCNTDIEGRIKTVKKEVPTGVAYLSRAMEMLLPRLADLKKSAAYSFATYTSALNAFDMATFTVIGPESITVKGQKQEAIRAANRMAEDAEPANVWLTEKGELLRMESADGLTMESATPEAVRKRFPKADAIVKQLGM